MSFSRLENQSPKIKQVVDDYRAGRLVIPEFQREYVWKPNRAPKLIDSLYRRFPISVLLLWTSDISTRSRRIEPRPTRSGSISWLIDGQQRVITLSKTIYDEGIDVVFNPTDEAFSLANAATKKDPNWYRVSEIFDDDSYRGLRRALPEGNRGSKLEEKFDRVRSILDYELPAVRMLDYDFDQAVEAFTRINTLGVKLKQEDIESARVAARHTGFIADEVAPYVAELRRGGFKRLNVMHLFRACAFVALPDGRSRTPLHELSHSEVMSAWNKTKRATKEALALVRNEFGLVNMDILWSGALLVPVIALCELTSPRDRDTKGIAGWIAMASLLHRYSKSSETALDQDLKACRADDPIGKLLSNVRKDSRFFGAVANDFNGAINDKGALFATYVACRHLGLRDLFSNSQILLQENVDRHHILPRAQFPETKRQRSDTIANIAFITGGVNRQVGAKSPDVYLEELEDEVLQSQCIPNDRSLWKISRADDFWAARRELLAEAFNLALKSMLPKRHIAS